MRLTEKDIIKRLKEDCNKYAPLMINRIEEEVPLQLGFRSYKADAIIEFSIQDGPAFEALIEIVPVATPKNILDRIGRLLEYVSIIKDQISDLIPMIVAPYIDSKQAKVLAEKGISWLDLCGNMIVRGSNGIYIERTGKLKRFPDTSPIKKIFQGKSALVSRALLLKPEGFSKLNEIVDFINNRNANVKISMVSKVLKVLEEELLITKKKKLISVTDPEKLLNRLMDGYKNSTERKKRDTYRFAIREPRVASMTRNVLKSNYLACGFYAAKIKGLSLSDQVTIFVKDMEKARKEFDFFEPDSEFGNMQLIETKDTEIWFNSVDVELTFGSVIKVTIPVVDDIELYLEMMVDTPRGPKIAEQLKQRILRRTDSDK